MTEELQNPPQTAGPVMDFETLKAKIWEESQVTIDDKDPVMVMRVIHQVALQEYEELLERHNKAITEVMSGNIDIFSDNVQTSIADFKKEVLSDSNRERLITITEQTKQNEKLLKQTKRQSRIMAVLTVLNLVSVTMAASILLVFFN